MYTQYIIDVTLCVMNRLPGNQAVLAGCDSGCLEVYRVQRIVLCETETKIQAHDDIILGVASLADGENVISVGQDSK